MQVPLSSIVDSIYNTAIQDRLVSSSTTPKAKTRTKKKPISHIIIQSFFPSFDIASTNNASSSANIRFSFSLNNPLLALSFIALRLLSISARARRSVFENGLWICEVDEEDPAAAFEVDDDEEGDASVFDDDDGLDDLEAITGAWAGAFAEDDFTLGHPTLRAFEEGEEELLLFFKDDIWELIAANGFKGIFVEACGAWGGDEEEVEVTTHLCELQWRCAAQNCFLHDSQTMGA